MLAVILLPGTGCQGTLRDWLGTAQLMKNDEEVAGRIQGVEGAVVGLTREVNNIKTAQGTLDKKIDRVDSKYQKAIDLNDPGSTLSQLVARLQTAPPRREVKPPEIGGASPGGVAANDPCLDAAHVKAQLDEAEKLIETVDAFRARVCKMPCAKKLAAAEQCTDSSSTAPVDAGELDVSTSVNGVRVIYKGPGSLPVIERILEEQQEKSERRSPDAFLHSLIKNGKQKTDQDSRVDDVDARKTALERDLPEKLSDIESEMRKHGEGIVGINARMDVFHKRIEELAAQRAAKVEYRPPVGTAPGPVYGCGGWNVCPNPSRRVIHAWAR